MGKPCVVIITGVRLILLKNKSTCLPVAAVPYSYRDEYPWLPDRLRHILIGNDTRIFSDFMQMKIKCSPKYSQRSIEGFLLFRIGICNFEGQYSNGLQKDPSP